MYLLPLLLSTCSPAIYFIIPRIDSVPDCKLKTNHKHSIVVNTYRVCNQLMLEVSRCMHNNILLLCTKWYVWHSIQLKFWLNGQCVICVHLFPCFFHKYNWIIMIVDSCVGVYYWFEDIRTKETDVTCNRTGIYPFIQNIKHCSTMYLFSKVHPFWMDVCSKWIVRLWYHIDVCIWIDCEGERLDG